MNLNQITILIYIQYPLFNDDIYIQMCAIQYIASIWCKVLCIQDWFDDTFDAACNNALGFPNHQKLMLWNVGQVDHYSKVSVFDKLGMGLKNLLFSQIAPLNADGGWKLRLSISTWLNLCNLSTNIQLPYVTPNFMVEMQWSYKELMAPL